MSARAHQNEGEMIAAASAPGRVCLAGEDLDWLGGGSVQAALDLRLSYRSVWLPHAGTIAIEGKGMVNGAVRTERLADVPAGNWASMVAQITDNLAERNKGWFPAQVSVDSALPPAAGLASSAALTVAVAGALSELSDTRSIMADAARLERSVLGRSVGPMDYLPCAAGGVTWCECADNDITDWGKLSWPSDLRFIVVDTLRQRDTSEVIRWKRLRAQAKDQSLSTYVRKTCAIVSALRQELSQGQPDARALGRLVSDAHKTMRDDLRVSNSLIEKCVDALEMNGALGAKVSGTGFGGCVAGLVYPDSLERVDSALSRLPVYVTSAGVSEVGLQVDGDPETSV